MPIASCLVSYLIRNKVNGMSCHRGKKSSIGNNVNWSIQDEGEGYHDYGVEEEDKCDKFVERILTDFHWKSPPYPSFMICLVTPPDAVKFGVVICMSFATP